MRWHLHNMDEKKRIIQEYHFERMIIENKYEVTDGAKYLRTITPDPYGGLIDMPKDKFPEYYKWYEERNEFIKKYNELIQPFANFKNGDVVIIKSECNEVYVGIIMSNAELYYSEKNGSGLHYKTRKVYSWNEDKYPDLVDEDVMIKTISQKYFNEEVQIPLNELKSKLFELFENGKINDDAEKQNIIIEYNAIREDIHKRYWVIFDKGKNFTDDDKAFKQKYSNLICQYAKHKNGSIVILLDKKERLFFGQIVKEPFFEDIYGSSKNKICYDLELCYGWVSEYPFKPRTNKLLTLAYAEDLISAVDKELLETEIVTPFYNIQKKLIELIS